MSDLPPKISIILPTYNRAELVGRSIESVLEQTFDHYELIVVNDASTDETRDAIEAFDDDRIQYIEHDENKGASAARNTGIQVADGDLIAFQDSDDVWHERKLEKQVAAFRNSSDDVGVVYTGTRKVFYDSETYLPGPNVDPKTGNIHSSLLRYNFITAQAAVVRASCFEEVGLFDESLPALVDWDLWLRVSESYEFEFVDETLVTAYVMSDSISDDNEAILRAREHIVQKHRSLFDAESLARQLFWVGHGAMKLGEGMKGRKYLKYAVRTNPKLLYLASFGLSLLGSSVYSAIYKTYKTRKQDRDYWKTDRVRRHLSKRP